MFTRTAARPIPTENQRDPTSVGRDDPLNRQGDIYLSQVDGRGGQPTRGQGKQRAARARGRDASSQADAQIAHVVVLSLS